MTINEFLVKFEEYNKMQENSWHFYISNAIVMMADENSHDLICPITFVCYKMTGRKFNTNMYQLAGEILNLSREHIKEIIDANDNFPGCNEELRNKLINIARPK